MSKIRLLLVVVSLIFVTAVTGGYFMIVPPAGGPFAVVIPPRTSPSQAGQMLQNAGIIASGTAFTWCVRDGAQREPPDDREPDHPAVHDHPAIKPGHYTFNSGVYPWFAARILARGPPPPPDIAVTIPEGKRLVEIARILEDSGIFSREDADEFLTLTRDPLFARDILGYEAPSLEGYLFPDTYKFRPRTAVRNVIERLHHRFLEQIGDLSRVLLSRHEFVTLASIVEKEAAVPEERPRIAAVYMNRLMIGMRLQADPTVRYALDKWDTVPVLYVDLESNSPFNTYKVSGLPPGPISSVGRASLEAVAHPMITGELFFVARGDGTHIFSERYDQHLAHISSMRKR